MKTYQTDLPTMFGDHHVREVRRIMLDLAGIDEVYASSSFQFLQLDYDESQVKEEEIVAVLEQAGYMGSFDTPIETSLPATEDDQTVFRHTQAFNQTGKVSFHRETAYSGRPLWPCPGMGPLTKVEEE